MKNLIIIFFVSVGFVGCTISDTRIDEKIPTNIEEAFSTLDNFLTENELNQFKEIDEDKSYIWKNYLFTTYIKNNWNLSDSSSGIGQYFFKLGVKDTSDMTGIITRSFHRKINNKEIRLDEQIHYYKQYWSVVTPPNKSTYPKEVTDTTIEIYVLRYNQKNGDYGAIHVHQDSINDEIWIHDYNYGWKNISLNILDSLEDRTSNKIKIMNSLFYKK